MKLSYLTESDFKNRVNNAFRGKGKSERMGMYGISDEFGCDFDTAAKYLKVLNLGSYGEHDVDDKILQRSRAPQNLLKLLQYFDVDRSIINKLINFHIKHKKTINKHLPSPHDEVALDQLLNGERLVAAINGIDKSKLESLGLAIRAFRDQNGVWLTSLPSNLDILNLLASLTKFDVLTDLLHGLAFGYPMHDVFNYVRNQDRDLVDGICGHVDHFAK